MTASASATRRAGAGWPTCGAAPSSTAARWRSSRTRPRAPGWSGPCRSARSRRDLRPCTRRQLVRIVVGRGQAEVAMETIDLPRDECLHLLAGERVGRVICTEDALPAARPVTYLLDGEEVVFRAPDGSSLDAATRRRVVGFEVDVFDLATRTGWSVIGVGVAYQVTDPRRLVTLSGRIPEPWADGSSTLTVAVP